MCVLELPKVKLELLEYPRGCTPDVLHVWDLKLECCRETAIFAETTLKVQQDHDHEGDIEMKSMHTLNVL